MMNPFPPRGEALVTLKSGGSMGELMLALASLMKDPSTPVEDFLLGLKHPAAIAEQAMFELYRRTGRPWPKDGALLDKDYDSWAAFIR